MENELRILIKGKTKKTISQLAKDSGISRNTIGALISADTFPRQVKVCTLDRIARTLGYRVRVSFEPLND